MKMHLISYTAWHFGWWMHNGSWNGLLIWSSMYIALCSFTVSFVFCWFILDLLFGWFPLPYMICTMFSTGSFEVYKNPIGARTCSWRCHPCKGSAIIYDVVQITCSSPSRRWLCQILNMHHVYLTREKLKLCGYAFNKDSSYGDVHVLTYK